MALVIAVTRECDGCIVAHARGALRAGVTPPAGRRSDGRGDLHERRTRHGVGTESAARVRRGGRGAARLNVTAQSKL